MNFRTDTEISLNDLKAMAAESGEGSTIIRQLVNEAEAVLDQYPRYKPDFMNIKLNLVLVLHSVTEEVVVQEVPGGWRLAEES